MARITMPESVGDYWHTLYISIPISYASNAEIIIMQNYNIILIFMEGVSDYNYTL